ncbi:MAG: hypothetical protein HS117_19965 [Verrucomicrobiaceae bacterium]|nr:hypothetical protein [Verrucomicrobiaceae bacterium]
MSTPAAPPTIPAPPPQVIPGGYRLCRAGRSHPPSPSSDPRRWPGAHRDGSGRNVGKRLDATLKHLVALRGAGLVVTAENPQDGRRLLYHLTPAIPATKTERGWEMDFGYCLVRIAA